MTYKLPDLPYDFGALEPVLTGEILELHHGKHHAAYVKNANAALERIDEARETGKVEGLAALERALAFNVSGHVLHSIYWRNMRPHGGGEPTGEIAAAIADGFGSLAGFQAQMNEAAGTTMGSGWAALVWEPVAKRLFVAQVYDHQANLLQGSRPLLVLDAWEHAYYLQYQNRKPEYCKAFWNVVNWDDVEARFAAARRTDAGLPGAAG
jgi:superoxide dismutase, Fe-Mn family